LRYLYLGLYVADCRHLAYKARFLPHERLVNGEWRRFDRESGSTR
jgi:arginine-tRNA-protein transferase